MTNQIEKLQANVTAVIQALRSEERGDQTRRELINEIQSIFDLIEAEYESGGSDEARMNKLMEEMRQKTEIAKELISANDLPGEEA